MRKAYKFKLFLSKKQKRLTNIVEIASEIHNHFIALQKRYYRMFKKHISYKRMSAHLTKLKKLKRYERWKLVPSQAAQNVLERIDKAYARFFDWAKKRTGPKMLPPRFKKRSKYKSITLKQAGWKIDREAIWLNGLRYRVNFSQEILGTIKTITLKRDSLGEFYICISVEGEFNEAAPKTCKTAGFDFSFKKFLVPDSDNSYLDIKNPLFYLKSSRDIAKANRELSRKVPGSNNRKKAHKNLARVYRDIENRRADYQNKLARELMLKFDTLCFEDLNIAGMKKLWGKKVSDLSFSRFVNFLSAKSLMMDKEIVKIDRWFPSSKSCSKCGFVLQELSLNVREWTCPECGAKLDRDINAADNIKRVGTSTLRVGTVRPA